MKAIVTNIEFDTDGEIVELPNRLEIEIPIDIVDKGEIDDFVSDEISNITGFCHYGFQLELI